jgi:hypothetical protein
VLRARLLKTAHHPLTLALERAHVARFFQRARSTRVSARFLIMRRVAHARATAPVVASHRSMPALASARRRRAMSALTHHRSMRRAGERARVAVRRERTRGRREFESTRACRTRARPFEFNTTDRNA